MNDKWHQRFLELAEHIASWSKDPSTKVGCVLVDGKRRVVGMGYNGFPRGVNDHPSRYEYRDKKYLMVQHAEANAILNAVGSTEGATAYVTHHPCSSCMGLLIQAGVAVVAFRPTSKELEERFSDSFLAARDMALESGVTLLTVRKRDED